ncbi:MAG: DNA-3-methyladenine glycosylase 2 family protein, partial [Betaproteobacteria bacterium]|nr:DNA-3-methyladenine glycosylase 2 family protein [Betaproteobacteria bacterium]
MLSAVSVSELPVFTPHYWDEACKHLMKKDRVMKRLIPIHG